MLEDYQSLFKEVEFQDAIKAKKVCLFLGSGVGFNIGMPDWQGLANRITKFCLQQKIITRSEKLNLLSLNKPIKIISICTEKIKNKNKEQEFNNLLRELFYETPQKNFKNSKIYNCLNKLYKEKAVLILQTNYDVMIEKFQSEEEGLNRNFYIPYINMENPSQNNLLDSIIYLHGRFSGDKKEKKKSSYEQLVLSKEQYNRVYILENSDEYKRQKQFIKELLKEFYIIFLGYSLSDEEILQIIANKPNTENFKQISVIVDNCEAKVLENEFNKNYLDIASNHKIKTYVYDTDSTGIEQSFEEVIENLTKTILNISKEKPALIRYTNPEEVDFG